MKQAQTVEVRKKSHFLRNLIIIFVSALLVLGIVLGAISLARGKNAYARYSGIIADKATYAYLLSYYKLNHMRALAGKGAEDTEAFWSSKDPESGKTQGELLSEGAKSYVSRVLISAALFDSSATGAQKKAAKEAAKQAAEEILTYRAGGDEKAFDEIAAPFGYAYKDLEKIALLLYKAENAQSLFYGLGGETVSTRLAECNGYLSENYSAVYLFFIRENDTFIITEDENGNSTVMKDENGDYVMHVLTDEEKAKRQETIGYLDSAIEKGTLTKAYFEGKMEEHYKNVPEGSETLYYFADGSAYTESFKASVGEDIVSAAETLAVGKCQKVAYEHGVCFVYKCDVEQNAFANDNYESFFSDFYENVADYLFAQDVAVFKDDVVFTERASEFVITALPYKNFISVRF